jgi:hypothetical protein
MFKFKIIFHIIFNQKTNILPELQFTFSVSFKSTLPSLSSDLQVKVQLFLNMPQRHAEVGYSSIHSQPWQ